MGYPIAGRGIALAGRGMGIDAGYRSLEWD